MNLLFPLSSDEIKNGIIYFHSSICLHSTVLKRQDNFNFSYSVQTDSETHPASCPMGTGGLSPHG
jgi:hypothetical protein